ncbi:MAG: DUF4340 domain-containing protein [bacterium]|nr:DUF4340 domain-containing protein [bacterium]
MNVKKTLIIAIVFMAILGYYLWDQNRLLKQQTRKEAESRLVTPHREDLTAISVTNEGKTLKLARENDEWQIVEPVKALADKSAVEGLLSQIDQTKKENPFEVAEGKLGDYGLAKPRLTAQIEAAGKKYSDKIELGAKTPDDAQVYTREAGGKNVFVVPAALQTELTKTVTDLRDKRLLPADLTEATTMTLTYGGQILKAQKKNDHWKMLLPSEGPADDQNIGELLRTIYNSRASDFIDTATLDLARYGLAKPAWKGAFYVAKTGDTATTEPKGREWTLLIGDAPTSDAKARYAMQEGGHTVFQVKAEDYGKMRPSYDDLRDKALFTLKPDQVGTAILNVKGNVIRLTRDAAGQWRFAGDDRTALDQLTVDQKIRDLTEMKAVKFITTPPIDAQMGFNKPTLVLTVASKDGRTTETLMTGEKAPTENYVYARQMNTGQTYGIDWTVPGKFIVTPTDLEDKAVYRFDIDLAHKIELTENGRTITFVKKGQSWTAKAQGSDKEYQIEGPKISSMLYKVMALNWKRKLDPKTSQDATLIKTMNLESPPRQIAVYDDQGKQLAWLGQGGIEATNVYISRGKSDYMTVDQFQTDDLKRSIDAITAEMTKAADKDKDKS